MLAVARKNISGLVVAALLAVPVVAVAVVSLVDSYVTGSVAPIADAGPDVVVTLPNNRIVLAGTVTTTRAEWVQLTGPAPAIFDRPDQATTAVTLPVAGGYLFRLIARNAGKGVIGSDQVRAKLLVAPAGTPAAVTWKPLAIGAGGFITGIDLHRGGTDRVIRTDTYGAYIWNGSRWVQLVTAKSMPADERAPIGGGVTDVVIAPTNVLRLYMYYNSRFYRSNDRGQTWVRSAAFGVADANANDNYRTQSHKIAVDPINADIVYVGTRDDGLRRSVDGGQSWTTVSAVPVGEHLYNADGSVRDTGGGISVFFDASAGGDGSRAKTVYASSWNRGIWRSNDFGAIWTPIAGTGNTPRSAARSAIAGDGTLYVIDGANGAGKTWRWRANSWTDISPAGGMQSLTVDPTNPDRIYVFSGGGDPWRSINAGANWTRLQTPSLRSAAGDIPWLAWTDEDFFTNSEIKFDPKLPGRIWAANGIGVWWAMVSDTTTRITWQAESRGIEQLVINDIIAPPGGKPVTAAWDRATFVHENVDTFPNVHGPTKRFNSAWNLDWSASNPRFIVANTSDHRFCCGWDGLNIQAGWSEDGGRTWTRFATQPTPPGSDSGNDYRFAFGDIAVSANDINNIIWLPTWDSAPAITRDRGASWQFFTLPNKAADESTGWHGNYYLNRKILAADRVRPSTFYLVNTSYGPNGPGAPAGVWRTIDGGSNWTQVFKGWITDYAFWNAKLKSVPGREGHLFFTPGPLDGNPDIPLKRSLDGGASWTAVPGASRVAAFGFGRPRVAGGYPTLFIAGTVQGAYGVWRSTDEGASWTNLGIPLESLDSVTVIDGDKDIFGRVYVGFAGSGAGYRDSN